MAYYPKNKIQQNLQTNGGEYKTIVSYNNNGPYYVGSYYKLATGKYYTGKFPGDGKNEELILISFSFQPTMSTPSLTVSSVPPMFPTPEDYKRGVFTRYFKKKRNELLYEELTKDQYNNNVDNTLYFRFQLQWQLTGDRDATFNTNRNMVLLAQQNQNAMALGLYLKEDYIKYYNYIAQDNLYTNGGEFKTPNGINYTGPYHVHPDKGPMVGATHSTEPHSILISISSQPSTGSQNTPPIQMSTYVPMGGSSY